MGKIRQITASVALSLATLAFAEDLTFFPHYAEALAEAKSSGLPLLIEFRCVP
ncbi:MAG: hypothetical protein AAB353_11925 [Candidatus Hydrogenedentota bacterium]